MKGLKISLLVLLIFLTLARIVFLLFKVPPVDDGLVHHLSFADIGVWSWLFAPLEWVDQAGSTLEKSWRNVSLGVEAGFAILYCAAAAGVAAGSRRAADWGVRFGLLQGLLLAVCAALPVGVLHLVPTGLLAWLNQETNALR